MIDLNHGSQAVYGSPSALPVGDRINALIDAALIDRNRRQAPRDYLGGSRIGEPCARKLAYEYAHADVDIGKGFDGRTLRIFDAGHQFETLSIRWLRAAGFDLRTHRRDGGPVRLRHGKRAHSRSHRRRHRWWPGCQYRLAGAVGT